ncbi:MAG TPA: hypothetical protein VNW99_02910 [Cytophagaceae bacterium]|jgi:hypothetical protein|nr:hypothetical protein [Cytophagaceae bacterium]
MKKLILLLLFPLSAFSQSSVLTEPKSLIMTLSQLEHFENLLDKKTYNYIFHSGCYLLENDLIDNNSQLRLFNQEVVILSIKEIRKKYPKYYLIVTKADPESGEVELRIKRRKPIGNFYKEVKLSLQFHKNRNEWLLSSRSCECIIYPKEMIGSSHNWNSSAFPY